MVQHFGKSTFFPREDKKIDIHLIFVHSIQGTWFIYRSFYNTGLHNDMQVVVPVFYRVRTEIVRISAIMTVPKPELTDPSGNPY